MAPACFGSSLGHLERFSQKHFPAPLLPVPSKALPWVLPWRRALFLGKELCPRVPHHFCILGQLRGDIGVPVLEVRMRRAGGLQITQHTCSAPGMHIAGNLGSRVGLEGIIILTPPDLWAARLRTEFLALFKNPMGFSEKSGITWHLPHFLCQSL